MKTDFLLVSIFCFYCGLVGASDSYGDVSISGGALKALHVAYKEFDKIIYEKETKNSEFSNFLSKIENYSISFGESENSFYIKFSPNHFNEKAVFGGGAEYTLDKLNYKILNVKYSE